MEASNQRHQQQLYQFCHRDRGLVLTAVRTTLHCTVRMYQMSISGGISLEETTDVITVWVLDTGFLIAEMKGDVGIVRESIILPYVYQVEVLKPTNSREMLQLKGKVQAEVHKHTSSREMLQLKDKVQETRSQIKF